MKRFTAFWQRLMLRLGLRPLDEAEDEDAEFIFTEESDLNYDRDPFLHSLSSLTAADIPLSKPPKNNKKQDKLFEVARSTMLVICILVFVGSIVYLIDNFAQKAEAEILYGEAAAEFEAAGLDFGFLTGETAETAALPAVQPGMVTALSKGNLSGGMMTLTDSISLLASGGASSSGGAHNEELEKLRALLNTYEERNEDVTSYLRIPGVDISYVVVQGDDNDYYLNHTYKKEYLVVGSIYMDYRNSESLLDNHNTVLYGHNIENPGIMFHRVTDFFDAEIFENELIYLYTMEGVFVYKPFAIYSTRPDSGYIRTDFATEEEFVEFCEQMKKRSKLASDVTFDGDERLLTLSTCTNYNNGRYALHAYLVDHIN